MQILISIINNLIINVHRVSYFINLEFFDHTLLTCDEKFLFINIIYLHACACAENVLQDVKSF